MNNLNDDVHKTQQCSTCIETLQPLNNVHNANTNVFCSDVSCLNDVQCENIEFSHGI